MTKPTITVRIAFSTAPFAVTPTWTDVSATVMGGSIKRGRQHQLDRMDSGTATVELKNTSGDYWPNNAVGAYYPNILPGKRINIRATYNAVTYDLYTGFIEKWDPGFLMPPIKGPVMSLSCADLIKNFSRLLLNNAGEVAELSGTRVGNVADELAWPAADRTLDAGLSTLQATGAQANINAQDHLQKLQQSESGTLFIAPTGYLTFHDRSKRLKSPYNTSQATFGDDPGELGYHRLEFAEDDEFVYNDVRVTRTGGTEQTASDATSQTAYGKRSLSKSGLIQNTDGECLSQAQYLLSRYKDPASRIRAMVIRPGLDEANLYPKVLGYDIGTRITVRLNQASIDEDYHIERIEHKIMPDNPVYWETKWHLTNADNLQYWVLGTAGYSELGETTKLFY